MFRCSVKIVNHAVMKFIVKERLPTTEEYNELRRSVEWPTYTNELVERGLANTFYSVVVETENGNSVGMGRIIGDDAIYLHIQDIIVRPEHQNQGVGKLIMTELMKYIDKVAGNNTNIGLMSSKGRELFYEKLGFIERPNEKFGSGMIKVVRI